MGQREAALASTEEAVKLYGKLAAARPDAFEPDLAMSLNNLGNRQSAVGQREEALASAGEAVKLYQSLFERWPVAFSNQFAISLDNYIRRLAEGGCSVDDDPIVQSARSAIQRNGVH